jgi:hypothetical protein
MGIDNVKVLLLEILSRMDIKVIAKVCIRNVVKWRIGLVKELANGCFLCIYFFLSQFGHCTQDLCHLCAGSMYWSLEDNLIEFERF